MDLNRACVLLMRPTTTWSPNCLSSPLISVVLPEPISPVNSENAAWDSSPYSSMVIAIACCRDGNKNRGSGVSEKGLVFRPKCRSYIARTSIACRRIRGTVQNRTHERRVVQEFDGAREFAATRATFGSDHQSALNQGRKRQCIVRHQHRRQVEQYD